MAWAPRSVQLKDFQQSGSGSESERRLHNASRSRMGYSTGKVQTRDAAQSHFDDRRISKRIARPLVREMQNLRRLLPELSHNSLADFSDQRRPREVRLRQRRAS